MLLRGAQPIVLCPVPAGAAGRPAQQRASLLQQEHSLCCERMITRLCKSRSGSSISLSVEVACPAASIPAFATSGNNGTHSH